MPAGAVAAIYVEEKRARKVAPVSVSNDWRSSAEVIRCRALEVPEELSKHRSWPRLDSPHRAVSIYPRSALSAVKVSWMRGLLLTLKRRPVPVIPIGLAFWHIGKVRKHLVAAKYPVTK